MGKFLLLQSVKMSDLPVEFGAQLCPAGRFGHTFEVVLQAHGSGPVVAHALRCHAFSIAPRLLLVVAFGVLAHAVLDVIVDDEIELFVS